jgi:hypothetical protein
LSPITACAVGPIHPSTLASSVNPVMPARLSQQSAPSPERAVKRAYPGTVLLLLGTVAVVLFIVGVLVVVGRLYPGDDRELVDWFPTRSPEVEVQNEIDDVRQMLEAQNEMRRRRGAPELTEADIEARVRDDETWKARMRGGS